MSTQVHGISWNIISSFSFIKCQKCRAKAEQANIFRSNSGARHLCKVVLSKCWYILKIAWHILVLLTVVHQFADFIHQMIGTQMGFQKILKNLRWRFKQLASVIILWIILRGQEQMGEVCLQRQFLESEALKFCTTKKQRQTLVDRIRKFGLSFNCVSLGLLFFMHLEMEADYSVNFHEIPYRFWPFPIFINFWLAELFFLLTVDILSFLPYFVMVWWCTLVQAGVRCAVVFRQQLKLTQSSQKDEIEKLQHIVLTLESFYSAMEESFSGIIFWHIFAALLTSLSFLGDVVNGTTSAHWLSALVAVKLLIWNIVVLVGIPNFFSIRFQEEVSSRTIVLSLEILQLEAS
jgi:hypothetical protein